MTIAATVLASLGAISLTVTAIAVCIKIDEAIRRRQQRAYVTGWLRTHTLEMLAAASIPVQLNRSSQLVPSRLPVALIEHQSLSA